jgi:hypothetical protein
MCHGFSGALHCSVRIVRAPLIGNSLRIGKNVTREWIVVIFDPAHHLMDA